MLSEAYFSAIALNESATPAVSEHQMVMVSDGTYSSENDDRLCSDFDSSMVEDRSRLDGSMLEVSLETELENEEDMLDLLDSDASLLVSLKEVEPLLWFVSSLEESEEEEGQIIPPLWLLDKLEEDLLVFFFGRAST